MNCIQFRRPLAMVLLLACIGTLAAAQDEPVYSIVSIVGEEKNWKLFGETKTRFTIEGRMEDRSQDRVVFVNCKLPFVAAPGVKLSLISVKLQNARVTGYFDLAETQPVFRVETLAAANDDAELARLRMLKIDREKPQDWFDYGDWVLERSEFYKDAELRTQAESAWLRGYELIRRRDPDVTPAKLNLWAEQMQKHGIAAEKILPWIHTALRMELSKLPAQVTDSDLRRFGDRVAERLPGAKIPLELPLPMLVTAYEEHATKEYDTADAETRRKLDRIFYRELVRRELALAAEASGANGNEIAARFDRVLPDMPELAEKYRLQYLKYRKANIDRASREQVLDLAREFRSRKLEQEAKESLTGWLNSRLRGWKDDGVDGLMHAAAEYMNLVEDRDTALSLLREAWSKDPDNAEVAKRLERMGLRLKGNHWLSDKEANALPSEPFAAAVEKGEVVPGMPAAIVTRLFGEPSRKFRSLSYGRVNEVWVYGREDQSQLSVYFQKQTRQPASLFRVIAVANRAAKDPGAQ